MAIGPRVLHVLTSNQRRGAEVFASDLIRAVRDLKGVEVDQHVALLRGGGQVEFPVETTDLSVGALPGVAGTVFALRSTLRDVDPQVVQVHGGEALRTAVLARARVPIVHRRIGTAPPAIRSGWRRRWHRALLRRAWLVLPVADHIRLDDIALFDLDPDRVRTIPNAIDPSRVLGRSKEAARAALDVDAESTIVLSLGSLSWEKDPLAALRASSSHLGPSVHHLFVGDGPLGSDVRRLAGELGVGPWVDVRPSTQDVGAVLAAADVVLFASRADGMEGMPAVLIEAGMARRPVVATDVAGVAEVVEDDVSGLLAPNGSPAALSHALAELLSDPARRQALGMGGEARCLARFRLDEVAEAYIRAWQEAAEAGVRGSPARCV